MVVSALLRSGRPAARQCRAGHATPGKGSVGNPADSQGNPNKQRRLNPKPPPHVSRENPRDSHENPRCANRLDEAKGADEIMRKLTRGVTPKFTQSDYERLQSLANRAGKPLATWCRDTLLALVSGAMPSPFQIGIMAEITATQAILIDMLSILGRDGRITTQKAQEIVDRAQNAKYKEAVELLRYAYSRAASLRLDGAASGEQSRQEERHEQ
jgi:hypothetical protein